MKSSTKVNSFLIVGKLHATNAKLHFLCFIENLLNFLSSFLLLVFLPIWYFPVRLLIIWLEPYYRVKNKKAIEDQMNRMFPRRKI